MTGQFARRYVFKSCSQQSDTMPASGRTPQIFQLDMGKDYSGPLGLAGNPGIPSRIYTASCSASPCKHAKPTPSIGGSVRPRGERFAGQASCSSSRPTAPNRRLHKFFVCSPQKGWGKSPSSQPETPKPVPNIRAFQNGGDPYAKRSFKAGGLAGKDRSQGCLSDSTHLERSPKIPSISLERQHARVCLPPIWPGNSPKGVHKIDETHSSTVETEGYSINNIPRRHPYNGGVSGFSTPSCSFDFKLVRKSRFLGQLQEVTVEPLPTNRVFRFASRFQRPYSSPPRGEIEKNSETVPKITRSSRDVNKGIIKVSGPPDLIYSGHFSSPPPLQTSSEPKKPGNGNPTFIRCHDLSRSGIQG